MNRRSFLGLMAGAGAASATSYFFAPVGGWKSDAIVHAHWSECPPKCVDHLHRWQVEKVLADFKQRTMQATRSNPRSLWVPPPGYTIPLQYSRL